MNWQVQQASVLAAEKRLEEQRQFFEKAKTTPSPPSTLSASSFASSSSSSTLASSTTPALPSATTPTTSSLKQLQKLPKSSLTKFIEEIQVSRQKAESAEPPSVKHLLASYDTKSRGSETFLDKLLNTLQAKEEPAVVVKKTVPAKKNTAEADFAAQLKDFISILEQLEQGGDFPANNEVVEQERRRDPDLSRGMGRQLGSFLEEELNEAAAESNQLSSDLDELLQELEG